MALDMCRGERIGDMGDDYIVVPVSKWRNTPWFEQAAISATVSFGKVGGKFVYLPNLPHPFYRDEDVLVQEYRHPAALGFVFQKKVAGQVYYAPYVAMLSPGVVRQLIANEMWRSPERLES